MLAEQRKMRLVLANVYFDFGCFSDYENELSIDYFNKALELYEIEQDNLGQGNVFREIGSNFRSQFSRTLRFILKRT